MEKYRTFWKTSCRSNWNNSWRSSWVLKGVLGKISGGVLWKTPHGIFRWIFKKAYKKTYGNISVENFWKIPVEIYCKINEGILKEPFCEFLDESLDNFWRFHYIFFFFEETLEAFSRKFMGKLPEEYSEEFI